MAELDLTGISPVVVVRNGIEVICVKYTVGHDSKGDFVDIDPSFENLPGDRVFVNPQLVAREEVRKWRDLV